MSKIMPECENFAVLAKLEEIVDLAMWDFEYGYGLKALRLLENTLGCLEKQPSCSCFVPVFLEYVAFARAEFGDIHLARELFGSRSQGSDENFGDPSLRSLVNFGYFLYISCSLDAALAEGWVLASTAALWQSPYHIVQSFAMRGTIKYLQGSLDRSISLLRHALHVLTSYRGCYPIHNITGQLGNAYFAAKRYVEAISCYEITIASVRQQEFAVFGLEAICILNIALCCHLMFRYSDALALFESSILLLRKQKCIFLLAQALVHYSCTLYHLERYPESVSVADEALSFFKLCRHQLTEHQKIVEQRISQRAYAWLALSNLKLGLLLKAIGYLEYANERSRFDEEMNFSSKSLIMDLNLDFWVPLTLRKLNTPLLLFHEIRYEEIGQQILSFLVLPDRDRETGFRIYFRKLYYGEIDIRLWMENKLTDCGVQGWNFKQFNYSVRRPPLPERNVKGIVEHRITHKTTESSSKRIFMFVVVGVAFALCFRFARQILISVIYSLKLCHEHLNELICAESGASTKGSQKKFKPYQIPRIMDFCAETVEPSDSAIFGHIYIDKTSEFLHFKAKTGITPIEPTFLKELKTCRLLYDIFLGPFSEELLSLGGYNEIIITARGSTLYIPFNLLLDSAGSYFMDKFKVMHSPSLMMSAHILYSIERTVVKSTGVNEADGRERGIWDHPVFFGRSNFNFFPHLGAEKERCSIKALFKTRGIDFYSYETDLESGVEELYRGLRSGSLLHIATHSSVFSLFVSGSADSIQQLTATDISLMKTVAPLVIFLNTCLCGGENYLRDSTKGLIRELLCCGVVCVVRSLSALDDNMARRFTLQFYELLLESFCKEDDGLLSGFTEPDIGDAVHLSMLLMSRSDRRNPQNWPNYMITGLWCKNSGAYL